MTRFHASQTQDKRVADREIARLAMRNHRAYRTDHQEEMLQVLILFELRFHTTVLLMKASFFCIGSMKFVYVQSENVKMSNSRITTSSWNGMRTYCLKVGSHIH